LTELNLLAACAFGLEALVKRELEALGYPARVVQPGKIGFAGDWPAIAQTNLWLRCADRVLIEVARFPAADFDQLFETTKAIDWSRWLPRDSAFPVNGRSRNSQLTSVPACQRSVKRAIVDSLKTSYQAELPETGPEYKIEIALLNDEATLTIDTTGPSLHKRGYRKLVAAAPLKESLAAAMIQLSVWQADRPLLDPFCGSGTIPIEAALIGLNIAPGLHRDFAFQHWPQMPAGTLQKSRDQALTMQHRELTLQISGTDRDGEVLKLARYHAERAGVADQIHFQQKPFHELRSKREYGCLITNPPYGQRLQERSEVLALYQSIPQILQRLPTWSHYILVPIPDFERVVQATATRRRKLYNGRIECTFYQFLGPRPDKKQQESPTESTEHDVTVSSDVAVGSVVTDSSDHASPPPRDENGKEPKRKSAIAAPVFGGLTEKDREQAGLFETRLKKRAKHLRRWPTKRGITCFRVYERDIPELPLVVDCYEDFLHITEYERPHDRDLGRHAAWLELMKKTAAAALDVPIQRVVLKSRERRHDKDQYEKQSDQGKLVSVHENGLTFLVNLTDYVDTGLFLDHRNTRRMVRAEAAGKRFLNLFAYTGSFTVYAAAGGAQSTISVDTSNTYLQWARRNMAENGFDGPQHRFVAADALRYLQALPVAPLFDLAVVDPPTFSNNKGLQEDWDVQARHAELLEMLAMRMSPGGIVFFSSNFRRFKLAESELPSYSIREISNQTIPEDFRNRRIHRCWRMVVGNLPPINA